MSAFLKKNPRLASLVKSDEALAPNANKSSTLLPGVISSSSGAAASLCSTGIPSMDAVLGGGVSLGSTLLVHEDVPASKANFCWSGPVRCFLSECIAASETDWTRKDGGWMAVVGHDVAGLLKSLPKATTEQPPSTGTTPSSESMKIAWRYEGMREFDSSLRKTDSLALGQQIGHSFDLGRKFDGLPKQLEERSFVFDLKEAKAACLYQAAMNFIEQLVRNNQRFGLGRIVVGSLGTSGVWTCGCEGTGCGPVWFTRKLTNLLQETEVSHPCVCLMTVQSVFLNSSLVFNRGKTSTAELPVWIAAVENLCDAVVELKPIDSLTFKSEQKSPLAREYDGFLIVKKPMRRPNSFRPSLPETQNLVFKIRRRRFVIEKFHLPPTLNDAPESTLCSSSASNSGKPHPLDF